MPSTKRNFLLFKTDLFVSRQRDEDIDRVCLGGDCARWFQTRMLSIDGIQRSTEPLMEDWGWTFALCISGVKTWINVWVFHGIENCWLIGLEPKKGLFRWHNSESLLRAKDAMCDALEKAISAEPKIVKHSWFEINPFWELKIKEF